MRNLFLRRYHREPKAQGRLSGLVFVVKDFVKLSGQPLSYGLRPYLIERCERDAALVKLLEDEGARLIASTNMDPAALTVSGCNPFFGDVTHPFDKDIPIGGSSGAAACAVALKEADFAVVSDHGGSARIPAAYCGLYGLKFSPSVVDRSGLILLKGELDCPGLITREFSVLERLLEILGHEDEKSEDPGHIFIPSEAELSRSSQEIREQFLGITAKLKNRFSISSLPENLSFARAAECRKVLIARAYLELFRQYSVRDLTSEIKALRLYGESLDQAALRRAQEEAALIQSEYKRLSALGAYIFSPALPNGLRQPLTGDTEVNIYQSLANLACAPAIVLPGKLPLHLSGAESRETSLIKLARNIELSTISEA